MMNDIGAGESQDAPRDGENLQAEPQTFEQMELHPDVRRALDDMGYTAPMAVQSRTFREILAGKDLLVQSRTGSGKTAAFGIPFAQGLIDPSTRHVQALVLSPTRELALQIATECGRIVKYRDIAIVPVYGGAPMGRQIEQLQGGAQVVAGTPGRVLDHLRRGTLSVDRLKVLVLDECDEMLSMGFAEEIQAIVERCPQERQTLLFSATIPEEIERISRRYLRDPEKMVLSADFVGVHEIKHVYYFVSGMGRARDLVRVLEAEKPTSAIIFCNTREETALVADYLRREGLDAEAISSDLTQRDRERVMGRMRAGNLHYLVATDIAARGIDISDLSHVINYTFPESAEIYVHRTGRTGRAGKSGVAISLISPRELGNFYYLKLTYKIRPEERTLPSQEELASRREGERIEQLTRTLGGQTPGAEWRSLARRLWASDAGETLVAALLEQYFGARQAARTNVAPAPAPAPAPRTAESTAEPAEPTAVASREGGRRSSEAPAASEVRSERRPREARPSRPERERRSSTSGPGSRRSGGSSLRKEPGSMTTAPRERGNDTEERARAQEQPGGGRSEAAPSPPPPVISTEGGKEFWEAWVEQHHTTVVAPPPAGAATEPAAESRRSRAPYQPEPGTARLYLNVGRRDRLTTQELGRFLGERGLSFRSLQVHGSHSYFVVDEGQVDAAIGALTGAKFGERSLVCERSHR